MARHGLIIENLMAARPVKRLMHEIAPFIDPEGDDDGSLDMLRPRLRRIMLLAHDQPEQRAKIGIGVTLAAADR